MNSETLSKLWTVFASIAALYALDGVLTTQSSAWHGLHIVSVMIDDRNAESIALVALSAGSVFNTLALAYACVYAARRGAESRFAGRWPVAFGLALDAEDGAARWYQYLTAAIALVATNVGLGHCLQKVLESPLYMKDSQEYAPQYEVWHWPANNPPHLHDGDKGFEYYGGYFFLLAIAIALTQLILVGRLLWLLYRPKTQLPVESSESAEADSAIDTRSG